MSSKTKAEVFLTVTLTWHVAAAPWGSVTLTWRVKLVSAATPVAVQVVEAAVGAENTPVGVAGVFCCQAKLSASPSGSKAVTFKDVVLPSTMVRAVPQLAPVGGLFCEAVTAIVTVPAKGGVPLSVTVTIKL